MKFAYKAKDRSGKASAGEVDASSLAEARNALRSQGLFVLELGPQSAVKALSGSPRITLFNRVKRTDVVLMLSQITIMCQSGVDLAEALNSVAEQMPKPALRAVMRQVSDDVAGGSAFSQALRKHPRVFDEAFVAGIAAGEQTGSIAPVLERLTYLLRGDIRLRSTVYSMLTYPLVLCTVTVLVLNAMLFFVLPQFSKVFADLGKPPPPMTQFLLGLGDATRHNFIWIVGALGLLGVGLYVARSSPAARSLWDYTSLNMVVLKHATRSLSTGRAFRLLGTMLMSGVPLVDGIRLCKAAASNSLFRDLFDRIEREVIGGETIGRTLLTASFLPSGAAQMIATAERTGKLGEVLKSVGEYFEDEGERHLRDFVKVLEPAIIVVLGLIVAGVVMSIILPLLDVSTMSK